jgi:hypothetical protein
MHPARSAAILILLTVTPTIASAEGDFESRFEDATLRVDFYQFGNAETEHIAIDRVLKQGAWAGPLDQLIDPHPFGRYRVRATDIGSGETIFEQGFDSIFGEYRSTERATEGVSRVYHETVLLPFPRTVISLTLAARDASGAETLLANHQIDPFGIDIVSEPPTPDTFVIDEHIGGDPHTSLDIAFVGEGYTDDQIDDFRAELSRFSDLLLAQQPYQDFLEMINIRGVLLPSSDAGCDEPTKNSWRTTAVGASFNTFGSPRYLLTESNRALRDIAANVPYDTLIIMVNHERYGGGGLYNRFCTFTTGGAFAGYLLLHEFGHSFGGLADEYYTSSTAYNDFYPPGIEPVQPNITAATQREALKWNDLVDSETPVPTPWDKPTYDRDDLAYQNERRELNAAAAAAARQGAFEFEQVYLRNAEERHALQRVAEVDRFMESSHLATTVGAFEGAGYVRNGLYRPMIDCLMFSRGVKPLCLVCRRAVAARIRAITGQPL